MSVQLISRAEQTVQLIPFQSHHISEATPIVYEAFSSFQSRHAVHQDCPDLETAQMIVSHIASRKDYTGIVAAVDGQVIGSNFLLHADKVAGVGPITVDPKRQFRGVGRALMEWAVEEAQKRGIRQIRLFQESVNMTSLSLYTSIGFQWRDSAMLMQAMPAKTGDDSVRPLTLADLPSIERLSIQAYGFSRAGDAAQLLAGNIPGFICERNGRATGYLIGSLFGHAGAESDDILLTLVGQAARHLPQPLAVFICPLSRTQCFRQLLSAGHRNLKMLSYMSYGDFSPPIASYFPSIQG